MPQQLMNNYLLRVKNGVHYKHDNLLTDGSRSMEMWKKFSNINYINWITGIESMYKLNPFCEYF